MEWKVPLADLQVGDEEVRAVEKVLRSGWLTQGPRVQAFEEAFSDFLDVPHAIAVSNGTAALRLAYRAAGLQPGDEFIVPALTFVATMNAGLELGARPVLADCSSRQDWTISVEDVARKLSCRTRLVVAMAYGGHCPDLEGLREVLKGRNVALIEDAAHAPGARIGRRPVGGFGLAGAFSFFSNKNMATGEGGMVVTRDAEVAERLRRLRSHGMTSLTWVRHQGGVADYDVVEAGYNDRMDELRAALGLEQLKNLLDWNAARCGAAEKLRGALEAQQVAGLEIPFEKPRGKPVWHLFPILLPPGTNRAAFRESMHEAGVQTSVHYPLLHHFSFSRELFSSGGAQGLGLAELLEERMVSLPMGPHLDEESILYVAEMTAGSLNL